MTNSRGLVVLVIGTCAFVVCFAAWTMFGIIGLPLREEPQLNSTEFGLLTATAVLTGSRCRLPLRIWTDRFGGRIVMTLLVILGAMPLSATHVDGVLFEILTTYVKGIVTFDGSVSGLMINVPLTYKLHILLGFSIFRISPSCA